MLHSNINSPLTREFVEEKQTTLAPRSPHKQMPGLCGHVACVTIPVAVDHPPALATD